MIQTFETRTQRGRVEIQEQSGWQVGQLQVRYDLRLMNGEQSLDRLYFNDHSPVHDQIHSQVAANQLTSIHDRHVTFAFHVQTGGEQLDHEAIAVDGFEKAAEHKLIQQSFGLDHREWVAAWQKLQRFS